MPRLTLLLDSPTAMSLNGHKGTEGEVSDRLAFGIFIGAVIIIWGSVVYALGGVALKTLGLI